MPVTEQTILDALRVIEDPDFHKDIVTLGFVKDIKASEESISVRIVLTTPACPIKERFRAQAEEVLSAEDLSPGGRGWRGFRGHGTGCGPRGE